MRMGSGGLGLAGEYNFTVFMVMFGIIKTNCKDILEKLFMNS